MYQAEISPVEQALALAVAVAVAIFFWNAFDWAEEMAMKHLLEAAANALEIADATAVATALAVAVACAQAFPTPGVSSKKLRVDRMRPILDPKSDIAP